MKEVGRLTVKAIKMYPYVPYLTLSLSTSQESPIVFLRVYNVVNLSSKNKGTPMATSTNQLDVNLFWGWVLKNDPYTQKLKSLYQKGGYLLKWGH